MNKEAKYCQMEIYTVEDFRTCKVCTLKLF